MMKGTTLLIVACCVLAVAPVRSFTPSHSTKTATPSTKLRVGLPGSSDDATTRRGVFSQARNGALIASTVAASLFSAAATPPAAQARLDPVDKPQLLPSQPGLNVIQTEKFLTSGEAKRMDAKLAKLESDTGWRVRVLCQSYPMTPGLAIREYWSVGYDGQKDDKYVVLVVDQFGGRGNVLNFNVGDGLRLAFPNNFWTQLQNKYGTTL